MTHCSSAAQEIPQIMMLLENGDVPLSVWWAYSPDSLSPLLMLSLLLLFLLNEKLSVFAKKITLTDIYYFTSKTFLKQKEIHFTNYIVLFLLPISMSHSKDSMTGEVCKRLILSWCAAASDPHCSSAASLTQSRYVLMCLKFFHQFNFSDWRSLEIYIYIMIISVYPPTLGIITWTGFDLTLHCARTWGHLWYHDWSRQAWAIPNCI